MSLEIFRDRDPLVAERRAATSTSSGLPSPVSRTSDPPGARRPAPPSAIASVAPPADERLPRLPVARPRVRASISSGATYGGLETTRSNGPARPGEQLAHELDRAALRAAFSAATASASAELSVADHARPGMLLAIASAIAPDPMPTSSTLGARAGEQREAALDDGLRLGSRDEHPAVDGQRQPAEAPLAEDVRERLARCRAGDESAEALLRSVSGRRAVARRARPASRRACARAATRHRLAGRAARRLELSGAGAKRPARSRPSRARGGALRR